MVAVVVLLRREEDWLHDGDDRWCKSCLNNHGAATDRGGGAFSSFRWIALFEYTSEWNNLSLCTLKVDRPTCKE